MRRKSRQPRGRVVERRPQPAATGWRAQVALDPCPVHILRVSGAQAQVSAAIWHAFAVLYLRSRDGSLRTGSSVSATWRWPAAFQ